MIGLFGTLLAATRAMRSPIRLTTRPGAFGIKLRSWSCDDDRLAGAEFQSRRDPAQTAILHRSTKHAGQWQLSFLDAQGPVSDLQNKSCTTILRELHHKQWRLRKVIPR